MTSQFNNPCLCSVIQKKILVKHEQYNERIMVKSKEITTFESCLSLVHATLEWAENQDVNELKRFLFTHPQTPLYCVSSGGSSSALAYVSLLYSAYKGMARMLTPLTFSSVSDEAIKNSKVLILSKSGEGVDVDYLTKRTLPLNAEHTAAITHVSEKGDNKLQKRLRKASSDCFVYDWEDHDGFIATISPFALFGLFYKTFTGDTQFVQKLQLDQTPSACFNYRYLRGEDQPAEFKDIKNYIVLYGGWGEPVAQDFESKMVEAGYASVQLCDYRNFCHGRFIFVSNNLENSALVLLMTPREQEFVRTLILEGTTIFGARPLFPDHTQLVTIDSEFDTPLASVDLLYKESVLFAEIGKSFGYEPNKPVNKSKIDKQTPRNRKFPELVEKSGLKGLNIDE